MRKPRSSCVLVLGVALCLSAASCSEPGRPAVPGPIPVHRPELAAAGSWTPPPSWFPDYPGPCPAIPESAPAGRGKDVLTKAEALAELRLYFDILRYAYAGYGYFGGDAAFLPAKAAAEAAVEALGDELPSSALADAVVASLSFVEDVHSTMGGRRFDSPRVAALDETLAFVRTLADGAATFWLGDGLARRRVLSVDGREPARLIKPSIDKEGRLVWRLAGLFPAGAAARGGVAARVAVELDALLGPSRVIEVELRACPGVGGDQSRAFAEYSVAGATLLRISRLHPRDAADEACLSSFSAAGAAHADDPLLIVDARGNGGGSDGYVNGFFEGLAGSAPVTYLYSRDRLSKAIAPLSASTARAMALDPGDEHRIREGLLARFVEPAGGGSGWSDPSPRAPAPVARDGLLVVLADRGVASSGETLVQAARLVRGSLVVGVPTAGCVSFGNVQSYRLPLSGLPVSVPLSVFVLAGRVSEGFGFEPDLWTPPLEAATRLEKFVARYGGRAILEALAVDGG